MEETKFTIEIPIWEMDDIITYKQKIIIKIGEGQEKAYMKIRGDKITNRDILDELFEKRFELFNAMKCKDIFIEKFKESYDVDCDFEI